MQVNFTSHNFYYSKPQKTSFRGDTESDNLSKGGNRLDKICDTIGEGIDKISTGMSRGYYWSAKSAQFLAPYMENLSQTVIPATALGGIISTLYPALLYGAVMQYGLFNEDNNQKETAIHRTKAICKKKLSPDDFQLAVERGLFNPIYERDSSSQFSFWDVKALTQLTDNEFTRAKTLFYIPKKGEYCQLSGEIIADICHKLSPKVFNKINKIFHDKYITEKELVKFCNSYKVIESAKSFHPLVRKEMDMMFDKKEADIGGCLKLAFAIKGLKDGYYESAKTFIKYYPDSPVSEYIYKCYLDNLSDNDDTQIMVDKCKNIYKKYKTQVYIGPTSNAINILDDIDEELSKWQQAGNGKAKLPTVIDFIWNIEYDIDDYHAVACAFHETRDVHFREHNKGLNKKVFRHELMHINDLKYYEKSMRSIMPGFYRELLSAGVPEVKVKYAHSDLAEFKAVAAEGDMSKYSRALKETLIKTGMPEWVFDLDK